MAGFGESVCDDGDTPVVGIRSENKGSNVYGGSPAAALARLSTGAGAAYVFVRSGQAWNLQASLFDSNPLAPAGNSRAWFGTCLCLSDETLGLGARGAGSPNTGGDEGSGHLFTRRGATRRQRSQPSPPPATSSWSAPAAKTARLPASTQRLATRPKSGTRSRKVPLPCGQPRSKRSAERSRGSDDTGSLCAKREECKGGPPEMSTDPHSEIADRWPPGSRKGA